MRRPTNSVLNQVAKIFSLRRLIYIVALIAMPALATVSVPRSWNPSVDSNVAGHKIFYGLSAHVCTNPVDIGNVANATSAEISNFRSPSSKA